MHEPMRLPGAPDLAWTKSGGSGGLVKLISYPYLYPSVRYCSRYGSSLRLFNYPYFVIIVRSKDIFVDHHQNEGYEPEYL